MSDPSNTFLQLLSRSDLALLTPHLGTATFTQGEVLAENGTAIRSIYFPESGLISVVVELSTGDRLEAALVGRTGVLGAAAAFGAKTHLNTAIAQMPMKSIMMKAADLVEAARHSESLRLALFRQEQFLLAQAQQTAACNAKHQILARLSTWLLRVRDATLQDDMNLTQEFLAQMLGVQRASISLVAGSLQNAGIIRYRRGHLHIADVARLEESACECYAAIRAQRNQLFAAGKPEAELRGRPIAAGTSADGS